MAASLKIATILLFSIACEKEGQFNFPLLKLIALPT